MFHNKKIAMITLTFLFGSLVHDNDIVHHTTSHQARSLEVQQAVYVLYYYIIHLQGSIPELKAS